MTAPAELSDPLVLQFASSRPDDLALLLGNCDPGELTTFIASLPVDTASSLAARLPSWQLKQLMGSLEPGLLCRMLSESRTDEAVTLVSHLHESRYDSIVSSCPSAERKALYQLLEYPPHSLASLATNQFIRVYAETRCGDFCEQLADSADTRSRPVLVADHKGKYEGMVNLQAAILRRNRSRQIGEIADRTASLHGLTDAATALTSRQWERHTDLPVVDGRKRILGVVNRETLLRVAGDSRSREFSLERVISELISAYLNTCSAVLESVLGKSK